MPVHLLVTPETAIPHVSFCQREKAIASNLPACAWPFAAGRQHSPGCWSAVTAAPTHHRKDDRADGRGPPRAQRTGQQCCRVERLQAFAAM